MFLFAVMVFAAGAPILRRPLRLRLLWNTFGFLDYVQNLRRRRPWLHLSGASVLLVAVLLRYVRCLGERVFLPLLFFLLALFTIPFVPWPRQLMKPFCVSMYAMSRPLLMVAFMLLVLVLSIRMVIEMRSTILDCVFRVVRLLIHALVPTTLVLFLWTDFSVLVCRMRAWYLFMRTPFKTQALVCGPLFLLAWCSPTARWRSPLSQVALLLLGSQTCKWMISMLAVLNLSRRMAVLTFPHLTSDLVTFCFAAATILRTPPPQPAWPFTSALRYRVVEVLRVVAIPIMQMVCSALILLRRRQTF
ncbi:unnamed protein product, partial [Prorocentrum cordatum]